MQLLIDVKVKIKKLHSLTGFTLMNDKRMYFIVRLYYHSWLEITIIECVYVILEMKFLKV